MFDYKPSYTWPNEAFPFRLYYEGQGCRVFIIENIQHNWNWLSVWSKSFRENDYFFVVGGWYHSPAFAKEAQKIFEVLSLRKDKFFFLFNSPKEKENFSEYDFAGDVIPHNAWLDESLVMRPLNVPKEYRAIYVARRSAFKRHMLASSVRGLALVAGINHGNAVSPIPEHVYLNDKPLTPEEVCLKINQSSCGLLLSETEGGCFSSSEYLLCGVPVVSTPNFGGRDVWYNQYNSIVCEPTPQGVAEAVDYFVENPRDPQKIRSMHVEQAHKYRERFIEQLAAIFEESGVEGVDAREYFLANFFHKMRKSYRPEFEKIFGK